MLEVILNGKKIGLKKACDKIGVKYSTMYQRMKMKNISFEEALSYDGILLSDYETNKKIKEDNKIKKFKKKTKKVMILNDIHIPYQLDDLIDRIKEYYNDEIDDIILGGDIIDCEGLSTFGKKHKVQLNRELEIAEEFLNELKEEFKPDNIYYIGGNHDKYRYERVVENLKEKDLYCLLPDSLIVEMSERVEGVTPIDHWYGKLYDNLIVCHPKNFSNVPSKVAEQCAEYFCNRGVAEKGDVIILGHTHKFSQIIATRRNNMIVVENGCLCKAMDYADTGKLSYGEQINCFTILEFEEGKKINYNNIKTYFI